MAETAAASEIRRPQYWSIQYLRGFAAIAVVIYHVYDSPIGPSGQSFAIGAHGVDVFFVISGFIMYTIARDEPILKFLARRLIRIFPFYWIATAVYVGIVSMLMGFRPSGTETVLSLALIPHFNEAHPAQIWPVLVPGWTLSYELYFYALFALGLWARRVIMVPAFAIAGMVALGFVLRPDGAILQVATNWLLIEFVLGLLLARAVVMDGLWPMTVAIMAPVVAAGAWLAGSDQTTAMAAALAIVAAALAIETRRPGKPIALFRLLGDASYAIYLFHFPALEIIEHLDASAAFATEGAVRMAIAMLATVAAVAIGVLVHLLVEKRLLRVLNRWAEKALARPGTVGIERDRRRNA